MKRILTFIVLFSFILCFFSFTVFAEDGGDQSDQSWWEILVDIVRGIRSAISELVGSMVDGFAGHFVDVKTSITTALRAVTSWLSTISGTLDTRLKQLVDWFGSINGTITGKANSIITWLSDIHSSFVAKLSSAVSWLGDINDTISDNFNTFWSRFTELSPIKALTDFFARPNNPLPELGVFGDLSEYDDDFAELFAGVDRIRDFIADALAQLVGLTSAFMLVSALINEITGISVLSVLVTASLCIGLLGLALNLLPSYVGRKVR